MWTKGNKLNLAFSFILFPISFVAVKFDRKWCFFLLELMNGFSMNILYDASLAFMSYTKGLGSNEFFTFFPFVLIDFWCKTRRRIPSSDFQLKRKLCFYARNKRKTQKFSFNFPFLGRALSDATGEITEFVKTRCNFLFEKQKKFW